MASEKDKESKSPPKREERLRQLKEKVKQAKVYLTRTIETNRQNTIEFVKQSTSIVGDLFRRFSLSLLSFVFATGVSLFLVALLAQGPSSSTIVFQGLLFGYSMLVATAIVYSARLLIWLRQTTIIYWKKRTPPFISEPASEDNRTSRPASVSTERDARTTSMNHFSGALLVNTISYYSILVIWSLIPITENFPISEVVSTIGKGVGLLYGGVVGLFLTGGTLPASLQAVNETTLSLLVFAVLIPALPLTITIRNFGYWLETGMNEELWSQSTLRRAVLIIIEIISIALLVQGINFNKIPI